MTRNFPTCNDCNKQDLNAPLRLIDIYGRASLVGLEIIEEGKGSGLKLTCAATAANTATRTEATTTYLKAAIVS